MNTVGDSHITAERWYQTGQRYNCAGQFEEAVVAYSTALESDPRHTKARLGRGLALQRLGDHEAAIRDFTDVLQRVSNRSASSIAYYGRACSLEALGRLTEAVDDCNQVLQSKADHIDALYLRGIAMKGVGNIERAAEDFSAVIEADPAYHEAYYTRATLFYMQGRWEEAIDDFSVVLRYASATDEIVVDSYRLRGIAAFHVGRNRAALADFLSAIEANPTDASIYMWRSQVYKAMGDSERAEADFKKATSLLSAR
jgi:tetratricopeptide (TPR) repeat protein